MIFRGVELRDWPVCVRTRLTQCRRHGHHFGLNSSYYCMNCAYPWFFSVMTDPPLRGPSGERGHQ